jgi:hypothetical protein
MGKEIKNLFLLTSSDIRRIRKLVRHLDRALRELVELKRVTTFDDERDFYPSHESDLIEQASFIEHQLRFRLNQDNQEF